MSNLMSADRKRFGLGIYLGLLICFAAFLTPQAGLADWNFETIADHPTWIFTPNGALPNGKHGVLVVLHGCQQSNKELKEFGNLEGAANSYGLIVAVPFVGDHPWNNN